MDWPKAKTDEGERCVRCCQPLPPNRPPCAKGAVMPQGMTGGLVAFSVLPFSLDISNRSMSLIKSVVDTFLPHQKSIQKSVRWFPRQRTPRLKDPTVGP